MSDKPEEIKEESKENMSSTIKSADANLDGVDSILTKITKILKKHWLILLLILVGYFVYWALTSEPRVETIIEPVVEQPLEIIVDPAAPFIVREYEELQTDGSIAIIEVWSDSVETVKK